MNLKINEMMNYQYENPEIETHTHVKIVENAINSNKSIEIIEEMGLHGSMTKDPNDANKIKTMINSYKNMKSENTINITR